MSRECLTKNNLSADLSNKEISQHLQQVVFSIQECSQDTSLVSQQISQLLKISKLNGWHNTSYFLEMAQSTLVTE